MAVSKIQIANMALGRAGVQTIASFTEESQAAEAINLFYERARRKVIRSHPWNFATTTAALARSTTTPAMWDYQYALPSDCLRPLYIYDSVEGPNRDTIKFEIQGKFLMTNEESVTLCYLKDSDDPNLYDENFIDAFAYQLAADIAMYISGDQQLQDRLMRMAMIITAQSQAVDANVGRNPRVDGSTFIDARG